MKSLLVLLACLLTMIAKLLGPGGARTIVACSLLMKQQLLVISRSRRRALNLLPIDKILHGFWLFFVIYRLPTALVCGSKHPHFLTLAATNAYSS